MKHLTLVTRLTRLEARVHPDILSTPADVNAARAKVQGIVEAYERVYPLNEKRQSLAQRYARSLGVSLTELKQRIHAAARGAS